jgi:16S rRNA (uracil1498-N3)-methyltransferase
MTRRRFFALASAFDLQTSAVTLTSDEARHLRDVLRLRVGDEVYVFDGAGREFRCHIVSTSRDSAELAIQNEVAAARPESPLTLTLGVALLKGEKFDLVVQKVTELGVREIVPIITQHADIHLRDKADAQKRVVRWQRIALEAAKQSGRALIPKIYAPVDFKSLVSETNERGVRLMFTERDGGSLNEAELSTHPGRQAAAIIGSEGGWADEELALAREAGWQLITLGGRVMRAETAAIAVTVLLQHLQGDLK